METSAVEPRIQRNTVATLCPSSLMIFLTSSSGISIRASLSGKSSSSALPMLLSKSEIACSSALPIADGKDSLSQLSTEASLCSMMSGNA